MRPFVWIHCGCLNKPGWMHHSCVGWRGLWVKVGISVDFCNLVLFRSVEPLFVSSFSSQSTETCIFKAQIGAPISITVSSAAGTPGDGGGACRKLRWPERDPCYTFGACFLRQRPQCQRFHPRHNTSWRTGIASRECWMQFWLFHIGSLWNEETFFVCWTMFFILGCWNLFWLEINQFGWWKNFSGASWLCSQRLKHINVVVDLCWVPGSSSYPTSSFTTAVDQCTCSAWAGRWVGDFWWQTWDFCFFWFIWMPGFQPWTASRCSAKVGVMSKNFLQWALYCSCLPLVMPVTSDSYPVPMCLSMCQAGPCKETGAGIAGWSTQESAARRGSEAISAVWNLTLQNWPNARNGSAPLKTQLFEDGWRVSFELSANFARVLVKVVQAALLQFYEGSSILQTSGCYVLCTLTAVKQPYQTTVYDLPMFTSPQIGASRVCMSLRYLPTT